MAESSKKAPYAYGRFVWRELFCSDVEKAKAFYSSPERALSAALDELRVRPGREHLRRRRPSHAGYGRMSILPPHVAGDVQHDVSGGAGAPSGKACRPAHTEQLALTGPANPPKVSDSDV